MLGIVLCQPRHTRQDAWRGEDCGVGASALGEGREQEASLGHAAALVAVLERPRQSLADAQQLARVAAEQAMLVVVVVRKGAGGVVRLDVDAVAAWSPSTPAICNVRALGVKVVIRRARAKLLAAAEKHGPHAPQPIERRQRPRRLGIGTKLVEAGHALPVRAVRSTLSGTQHLHGRFPPRYKPAGEQPLQAERAAHRPRALVVALGAATLVTALVVIVVLLLLLHTELEVRGQVLETLCAIPPPPPSGLLLLLLLPLLPLLPLLLKLDRPTPKHRRPCRLEIGSLLCSLLLGTSEELAQLRARLLVKLRHVTLHNARRTPWAHTNDPRHGGGPSE